MTWSIDRARRCYRIQGWGEGYFDINPQGHLAVRPRRDAGPDIDLHELAEAVRRAGLSWPVLLRFTDILRDRTDTLCRAFDGAIAEHDYRGRYTAAYPVKVNQQKHVVHAIIRHGGDRIGLEAGSKSELMAVLALSRDDGLIICNGYKDRDYVRLALIGQRLGQRLYLVIEKLSELAVVLEEADAMDIEPRLGVRVRLATTGAGNWQNTGGETSKFGLSPAQVLELLDQLRAAGRLGWLQLLHFHLGSQIASLEDFRRAAQEGARYYAVLREAGAAVNAVDVGGGLGVDYEGSRSTGYFSMNYDIEAYAATVVQVLHAVCRERQLDQPAIITEAGRAMTAHHAVLITNVIDVEPSRPEGLVAPDAGHDGGIAGEIGALTAGIGTRPAQEMHAAAGALYRQAIDGYNEGRVSLRQRAAAEAAWQAVCHKLRDALREQDARGRLLEELNARLADKYFCNLSVFQSLPDVWGIGQIFPVVPLQLLDTAPERCAILQDLTCDSDGHIGRYAGEHGSASTLPVHALRVDEPYLLGIFLVGAYQEILGDMHNLFGDTDSVNVELTAEGGFRLARPEHGDTVKELLDYVHLAPDELLNAFREKTTRADLTDTERADFLHRYETGLTGYTYHETDH